MSQSHIIIPVEPIWFPASYSYSAVGSLQSITVRRSGMLRVNQNGVTIDLGLWNRNHSPTVGDQWQVRMDQVSGAFFGNLVNTWLTLNPSDLFWGNSGTPQLVTGVLRLRRLGSTVELRSFPVSMENL